MTTLEEMLGDIDDVMFLPTSWKAIDVNNRHIARLKAGNRADAIAWIGQGQVASVFGKLRPGFCAVDVDVQTKNLGESIVEHVASWCEANGIWHIVRPSGGAAGRHHIFIRRDLHQDDGFQEMLADLREQHALAHKYIDDRLDMRPLTAKHRGGSNPVPYGGRTGIEQLWKSLPGIDSLPRRRRRKPLLQVGQTTLATGALVSPARFRRQLPREWALYLQEGTLPLLGGTDHSNSTYEARATKEMAIAGFTADEAWATICNANDGAMATARTNQRAWVRWKWNTAVREYAEFLKTTPREATEPPPTIAWPSSPLEDDLSAARDALWGLLWTVTPRRRDVLFRVTTAVLDRIERTGTRRIPVPERDLVLDAGVASRRAIREALATIDGLIGTVVRDTWNPSNRESSSFEFVLREGWQRGVSQISPPSSHTPLHAHHWHTLPRSAPRIWAALGADGRDLQDLAEHAALTETKGSALTPSQQRTAELVLTALAEAGLAVCDAEGRWHRRRTAVAAHVTRSHEAFERLRGEVLEERKQYRSAQGPSWQRQHQQAVAKDHARYRRWWDGLDPDERERRREAWQRSFHERSVLEQEIIKDRLARSRKRAGISEAARHQEWIDATPPEELAQRIVARTTWFESLPGALKQANVQAWDRHRGRHQVPRLGMATSQASQVDVDPRRAPESHPHLTLLDIANTG